MPGGELQRLIDVDETIAEPEVRRILRQVLEAVIFLHDRNIAHLDLKVSGGGRGRNEILGWGTGIQPL